MEVFVFERSDIPGSNMYLLKEGGHVLVVDPSCSPSSLPEGMLTPTDRVDYLLLTHAHFDHMLELDAWRELTHAPLFVGAPDASALRSPTLNCYRMFLGRDGGYFGEYQTVNDGDRLPLGDTFIEVIGAPGHTPGCMCYRIRDALFVGDLIFSGHSFGRYDLPGGDFHALRASLARFRLTEGNPTVYAGHGKAFIFHDEYN